MGCTRIGAESSNLYANFPSPTTSNTLNGPIRFMSSFRDGRVVRMWRQFNHTLSPTVIVRAGRVWRSYCSLYRSCARCKLTFNSRWIACNLSTKALEVGLVDSEVMTFTEQRG